MPPSNTETTVVVTSTAKPRATSLRQKSDSVSNGDFGSFISGKRTDIGAQLEDIQIKINGKWLTLSKEFVAKHPGGEVINQYKNADATHIFHAFHEGSQMAYKQLKVLEDKSSLSYGQHTLGNGRRNSIKAYQSPVAHYDISVEQEMKIVRNFENLRQQVHAEGLMKQRPTFYLRKILEVAFLMTTAFSLQYFGWYVCSALVLALTWQQFGWLTHEFCHHQPLKNRRLNDWASIVFGNVAQGFSRDWWKDKHNRHHASTNIIDTDPDIDLAPLVAMVPNDLLKYREPLEKLVLNIIPYQHLYFTLMLPLLRISWTSQSIVHVFTSSSSVYMKDRKHATGERIALALHWTWVLLQLYLLPSNPVRLMYFLLSQLLGGLLIALVVTYNHNSVLKYPKDSPLLNNFAALHILTTRNMKPSPFVDWFWGGLNYQVEHHLFPTMPRPNLGRCSKLVRQFCADNDLEYLVDDYWTGYKQSLMLLQDVAAVAKKAKDL
ncbi:fatty acid desaturase domain-containing protein [Ditylenchus destructor]|nr:fatty acid desaturase domain-containing protein [Ditylenchus destructor]